MLQSESHGDAACSGLLALNPAWLQLITRDGVVLYMHRSHTYLITTDFVPATVGSFSGGLLCDEVRSVGAEQQEAHSISIT